MRIADVPKDEKKRLDALHSLNILDTESEEAWDRIVQIASKLCKTPISLVSLIDENRQWFKAKVGLGVDETSRDYAFCAHAILGSELFVVPNAKEDERFADNPLVTSDPDIRFYAGAPFDDGEGNRLGTVCVIDRQPRELDEDQVQGLQLLAEQASRLIRTRRAALMLRNLASSLPELGSKEAINEFAHDLRTPLTPAIMHVENLKNAAGDDAAMVDQLEAVARNLQRLRDAAEAAIATMLDDD